MMHPFDSCATLVFQLALQRAFKQKACALNMFLKDSSREKKRDFFWNSSGF
jgi:hypothetical protein